MFCGRSLDRIDSPQRHIGFEHYRIKATLDAHHNGRFVTEYSLYSSGCRSEVVTRRARFPKGDVRGAGGDKCITVSRYRRGPHLLTPKVLSNFDTVAKSRVVHCILHLLPYLGSHKIPFNYSLPFGSAIRSLLPLTTSGLA